MRVLVACEESQEVCKAFRELGHESYSCDLQDCTGGRPEWHIQGDVLRILNPYPLPLSDSCGIYFVTMDNKFHKVDRWDLIIAHPPCTYLTVSGNRWFNVKKYGEKAIKRLHDRQESYEFFMQFVNADCDKIAIENPVGYMSSIIESRIKQYNRTSLGITPEN